MYIFIRVTILVFCLIWPLSLRGDDFALTLAEGLFKIKNYSEAITEYKRFIYFNPADSRVDDIHFLMGMAYRNLGEWENALKSFRTSLNFTANDSILDERRISIGVLFIAKQDYSVAEFELLRVSTFSKYSSVKRKAAFFLGVCYLYIYRWRDAQKAFKNYSEGVETKIYNDVDSLLISAQSTSFRSPSLAKWLSTFIPGSGQVYAGDCMDGLNALGINLGTGYLLLNSLFEKRYQDAFISYFPLFQRYYLGNRHNAERIAKEKNNNLNREHIQKILNVIHEP